MKRTFTLLSLYIFTTSMIIGQNELKIINPDWIWDDGHPGTIEEASFQIEPKGAYMEVGMFLTMSAQGYGYSISDTLEIVLDFNLPSGSIVHDSWLWLDENTIVKADVYDISQATEIYEDIVDRNEDPSLLYRKSNGSYQIRIFPLAGTESRKVKITFLAPAVWSKESVECWLPFDILSTSEHPLEGCQIISVDDGYWGQPYLIGTNNYEFTGITYPDMSLVWVNDILQVDFANPIRFAVDSPVADEDVFVSKLEDVNNENFYQVVYLPPELPVSSESKNIAVLFDHNSNNAHTNKTHLFEQVKANVLSTMNEGDQLNLFFSNGNEIEMASPTWVPCDSNSLTQLFSGLSDPINEGTNVLELLHDAIQFVKDNGGTGELLLFSNGSSYFNNAQALENVLELIGEDEINIHVVSYQTLNYYWYDNWNAPDELFYNYKWFFENLTFSTLGTYYSTLDHAVGVWENISTAFAALNNSSYNFDLDVNFEAGFSFDSYYQTFQGQSNHVNKPIMQVGRYLGDFPITIDFAGFNEGEFVFDSKTIDAVDVAEADTLSREIWFGHHIKTLEGNASNVVDVQDIVNMSIEERVLSRYTAFLALELSQGGEICMYCWTYDEPIVIVTEELQRNEFEVKITASPNPFADYCQLSFELKDEVTPENLSIQIFDAFGKLVKVIDSSELQDIGLMNYYWDGKNSNGQALSDGVYYLVVSSEKGVRVTKLVKIQ